MTEHSARKRSEAAKKAAATRAAQKHAREAWERRLAQPDSVSAESPKNCAAPREQGATSASSAAQTARKETE